VCSTRARTRRCSALSSSWPRRRGRPARFAVRDDQPGAQVGAVRDHGLCVKERWIRVRARCPASSGRRARAGNCRSPRAHPQCARGGHHPAGSPLDCGRPIPACDIRFTPSPDGSSGPVPHRPAASRATSEPNRTKSRRGCASPRGRDPGDTGVRSDGHRPAQAGRGGHRGRYLRQDGGRAGLKVEFKDVRLFNIAF
jgi:hypothetical protein